jgi:hypothetical protein
MVPSRVLVGSGDGAIAVADAPRRRTGRRGCARGRSLVSSGGYSSGYSHPAQCEPEGLTRDGSNGSNHDELFSTEERLVSSVAR